MSDQIAPPVKALLIFFDATDRLGDESLLEAIVRELAKHHIAGATAIHGIMGYGVHRRIHRKGLFGVIDDKPVTLIAVDNEQKLRSVVPVIRPMIKEGLLVMLDAEVV